MDPKAIVRAQEVFGRSPSQPCPAPMIVLMSLVALGCTPIKSWFNTSNPIKNQPQTAERPLVSNAFAYARYLANTLRNPPAPKSWSEDSIRDALMAAAVESGIESGEVLEILRRPVKSEQKAATERRIEAVRAQFEQCTQKPGRNALACCQALAWPLAILPEMSGLEPQASSALRAQASSPAKNQESGEGESRFRVQGMKAWLSVCHPVVTKQPQSLELFLKSSWVTGVPAGEWNIHLLPRSRAKRGPRRIHTRNDGLVSYAETLRPSDCTVSETEVILRRPDGSLNFWVYDASGRPTTVSHFPGPVDREGRSEIVEKPSPDSCMGCHYDFKTREFNVLLPSADELKLASTRELPELCRRPGEKSVDSNATL